MSESIGFDGNAEETGRRASHGCLPADVMGIVEVAAAALRTRAATSGTRCTPLVSEPCEASEEPIFFDGAHIVYIAEANGATSAVVAMFWGVYMVYIVETYGATSTVVAAGYVANIAENFFCCNALDALGRAGRVRDILRLRDSLLRLPMVMA